MIRPCQQQRFVATLILTLHCALLAWSAWLHSPTINEVAHLPAGISHLQYGAFELYRVNPPLPRMVTALPVLFVDHECDWGRFNRLSLAHQEVLVGRDFVRANGARTFWLYTLGRWAGIPFSIVGAVACYRWAANLFGSAAGTMALTLWCTCPSILGHGSLMMPDVPAAALGVTAGYYFWRWLRGPRWRLACVFGVSFGLAALSKLTLLVLLPIFLVLWLSSVWRRHAAVGPKPSVVQQIGMLCLASLASLFMINAGYAFRGTLSRVSDYHFVSRSLGGASNTDDRLDARNRFKDTAIANWRIPLPRDYVLGIDRQKADFEHASWSYLSEWQLGGWWYYHIYALAIKTPLGTLVIVLTAGALACRHINFRGTCVDEMAAVLPPIGIILLVSSQVAFSEHSRYTIPALPFIFVWASRVSNVCVLNHRPTAIVVAIALVWSMASSLWCYPHSISYFSELVGGPQRGHLYLLDSNIAWGQDLLFLRRWIDANPEARPIKVAAFGVVDPAVAGIDCELPPVGMNRHGMDIRKADNNRYGPSPGWYAVDVNYLRGSHWPLCDCKGGGQSLALTPDAGDNFRYFEHFRPTARVGYSFCIYQLTAHEVNIVRSNLGLPPLYDD